MSEAIQLSITVQASTETSASTAQRIGWALLIALTLYVCYFSHLGVIGFVGPDEPRYAWIARDMAETGDWVTPRLYGKPWFEKPVLYYWGAALSFKLFGVSEAAARLPSAISALLATLALAWLACRTYGEECARWLLLLLPTSVGMIGFSHAAATDMPFAGMLTIAMVCAAVVLGLTKSENTPILPRTPWAALLLFGLFLGLAVLAKGPAAIILSGGAVFFWAILTRRWRDAFRLLHPAAVASFCATALPWYILCARRNPDFFRVFIIEHNFKRYLTPEFQHIQPFWYYVPILLIAFLPWTFIVLICGIKGVWHLWRNRRTQDLTCLILSWVGFCFIFFTISKSKLPGYVLPCVPAIALLTAHTSSGLRWFSRRLSGYALVAGGFVYFVAAIWVRYSYDRPAASIRGMSWEVGLISFLVLGLFSLSTLFAGVSCWTRSSSVIRYLLVCASALGLILLIELTPRVIVSTHFDLLSGKALERALPPGARSSEGLRVFGFRRDYRYALNFYLHREIADWTEDHTRDGYVLSTSATCDRLKTADNCSDLWANYDTITNWSLFRITPKDSPVRLGDGRQPQ